MKWLAAVLLAAGLAALAAERDGLLPDDGLLARVRAGHGAAAAERLAQWRDLVGRLAGSGEEAKLEQVNRFFNRLPNVEDQALWGQRDYWATPFELLVRNGGDCEDFAIAKYFSLKAAGLPADKLRITYVRAWLPGRKRMESHMVLAYYPSAEAEPLILDNLVDAIRPAAARTDLVPTLGFNAAGLWSAKQRGLYGKVGEVASIRPWQDLNERMERER